MNQKKVGVVLSYGQIIGEFALYPYYAEILRAK